MRVLLNGNFYTLNKQQPWAQAVVIDGKKIAYVGTNEGARKFIRSGVEVSDLNNKFATPGFIDGHMHFFAEVVCRAFSFNRTPECVAGNLAVIKHYVASHKQNSSVLGIEWSSLKPTCWTVPEYIDHGLTRHFLDEICSDKPVVILLANGHEGVCNSLALNVAGVTRTTQDIDTEGNEYFQRDAFGEPTGYFVGMHTISLLLDSFDYLNCESLYKNANDFARKCSEAGLTSAVDCGNFYFAKGLMSKHIIKRLITSNWPLRLFACGFQAEQGGVGTEAACFQYKKQKGNFSFSGALEVALKESSRLSKIYNLDVFTCNFMKVIYDGKKERCAKISYVAVDDARKQPLISVRDLSQLGYLCAKEGININIHISYSDATHNVLEAAKRLRERGYDDLRITISHSTFVSPEDIELFAKYNVLANSTGSFIPRTPTKEGIKEAKQITGALSYPLKSIADSGGKVGIGSDCPYIPGHFNPLYEIEQVITRQVVDSVDGYANNASEGLSVEQAIEAYTINNAYQVHMEDKIGSLEVGKYADITIFDKNLFEVDKHEIHNVQVEETIMNGRTYYKNKK